MRAGQQCEYLATSLRTDSYAVAYGMHQQLIRRPLIHAIQKKILQDWHKKTRTGIAPARVDA